MGLRNRLATPRIFISYRRSDAGGYAGQLQSALVDHYGDGAITLDHSSIDAGEEFAVALDRALNEADVLLAVIGPDWVSVESGGTRRLYQEGDWVRREIVTALQREDVRVIPLLVGNAAVPLAAELPHDLAPLVALQAWEVRPDRFDDDINHLIDSIGGWRSRWKGVPIYAWFASALLLGAIVVAGLVAMGGDDNVAPAVAAAERVEVVAGEDVVVDILALAEDDHTEDLALVVDLQSARDAAIDDLGDGTVRYSAPRGISGSDSFGFRVVDDGGLETEGTIFVNVQPGALDGAFNVVVPEFSAIGDDAKQLARTLSGRAFAQTEEAVAAVTDLAIATAGPDIVGPIAGETSETRAEEVAQLADQLNANLVIFGSVSSQDDVSEVVLELYIAERGLTGATELAGTYEIGSIEQLTANPAAWELALAEFLDPRVRALSDMFVGLAHYQLNDYAAAEARFGAADAEWPVGGGGATNGRETVLQLLGNVAGLQDRDEEAAARYQQAIAIAPDYPRARFGLAEIQFQESRGPLCGGTAPAELDALEDAAEQFLAIATHPSPPLSFLAERSQVEVARIYLCLSLYDVDRAEDARNLLETVIAGAAANARLRNVVAEAHSSLATYHFFVQEDYPATLAEYGRAIDTTLDDNRRAFYHSARGDIYACLLDDPARAAVEYAASDALLASPRPRASCDAE